MRQIRKNQRLIGCITQRGTAMYKQAAELGIAPSYFSEVYCGRRNPTPAEQIRIAAYYGQTPEYFWPDGEIIGKDVK